MFRLIRETPGKFIRPARNRVFSFKLMTIKGLQPLINAMTKDYEHNTAVRRNADGFKLSRNFAQLSAVNLAPFNLQL